VVLILRTLLPDLTVSHEGRCVSAHGRCIAGPRTSSSATRIEASGSRGFTRKSRSITVPQLSQAITSQWCFEVSAAAIVGHAHMRRLPANLALNCWMVADASCPFRKLDPYICMMQSA